MCLILSIAGYWSELSWNIVHLQIPQLLYNNITCNKLVLMDSMTSQLSILPPSWNYSWGGWRLRTGRGWRGSVTTSSRWRPSPPSHCSRLPWSWAQLWGCPPCIPPWPCSPPSWCWCQAPPPRSGPGCTSGSNRRVELHCLTWRLTWCSPDLYTGPALIILRYGHL